MYPYDTDPRMDLAIVSEAVAPHLERLLARNPQGLRAVLAQWQALSTDASDPRFASHMEQALELMDPRLLLTQALEVDHLDVISYLVEHGHPLGRALHPHASRQDIENEVLMGQFSPFEGRQEAFLVAHHASRDNESPHVGLASLARLDPAAPGCLQVPTAGAHVSWLAMALFFGQLDQAEEIWKDRKASGAPPSHDELVEAAMALAVEPTRYQKNDRLLRRWWDRLMVPGVWDCPAPVKPGWLRLVEPCGRLRMKNLHQHLVGALSQAEQGASVDMLGVLARTLLLPGGASKAPTLRPADLLVRALAHTPDEPGFGKWLDKVQAMDWAGLAPDCFGRPMGLAALEASMSGSSPDYPQALARLWPALLPALPEWSQEVWWSLATTLATEGNPDPARQGVGYFQGRYDMPVHEPLLAAAAETARKQGEACYPRSDSSKAICAEVSRFWSQVVPLIEQASTPEASERWRQLREQGLAQANAIDPANPLADKQVEALLMTLAMPAPTSTAPRVRM